MSTSRRIPWLSSIVRVGFLAVLVAACGPTAQPGSTASQPKPAQSAPAAPADSAAAPAGWQAEWDRTVAAAKQEGKLMLSAPASELWRRALMTFEQDYPEIKVEYNGAASRDFWPRLFQERQGGQYLWDLRVGGPDPQVYDARDQGMLLPVRPLLVLPEVVDESKWVGGLEGIWADTPKTHLLVFVANGRSIIDVNRDFVPERDLRTDRDLLDPRWKGKIVLQDPRGGSGLGDLTTMLVTQGEEFVRDLLSRQDVIVTGDSRQQAEWVARGRYPIGLGVVSHVLLYLQNEGIGKNVKSMESGSKALSMATGGIQLIERPLHPNATKVFVNWLLTERVQNNVMKTIEMNSRRTDVPPGKPDEVLDRQQLDKYVPHQAEEFLPARRRALELVNELLR